MEKSVIATEAEIMSEIYESIMRGLQEVADDAAGRKKLPRKTVTVAPGMDCKVSRAIGRRSAGSGCMK